MSWAADLAAKPSTVDRVRITDPAGDAILRIRVEDSGFHRSDPVRAGQGGSGDIRGDLDARELASRLIEAWEGAALRGKVTRSRIPYDRFEAVTVPALLH